MDTVPQPPQETPQEASDTTTSSWRNKLSGNSLIILLVLLIVAGAGTYLGFSNQNTTNNKTQDQRTNKTTAANTPYTLIYGTWTQDGSQIKAIDLQSGNAYLLANLNSDIKDVSVTDSKHLLYIDNTNASTDNGTEITAYDISDKTSTTAFKATDGFQIDNYILSPDKQAVAVWEVKPNATTGVLEGGQSRIYTFMLSAPQTIHMIDDTQISGPTPYPIGILDNGTVYMDSYLFNTGSPAIANGMSISSFDGTQKQNLSDMANGTYGTQPVLSPDGKDFVFAGYNGSSGDGTANVSDANIKRALVSANTIETLSTQDNTRKPLSNINASSVYSEATWGQNSDTALFKQLSTDPNNMGLYTYSLASHAIQKIDLADTTIISYVSPEVVFVGTQSSDTANTGNLGSTYAQSFSSMAVLDVASNKQTGIAIPDSLVQYIDLKPTAYFSNLQSLPVAQATTNKQLQLKTFSPPVTKPSLAPQRNTLVSTSVSTPPPPSSSSTTVVAPTTTPLQSCEEVSNYLCGNGTTAGGKFNTTYCDTNKSQSCAQQEQNQMASCETHVIPVGNDKCGTCPLYLYGTPGTNIQVTALTSTYDSNIPTSGDYNVTLLSGGEMQSGNSNYSNISFDYTPALKHITPPTYGNITSKSELQATLKQYAQNLGLNQNETSDLISGATKKITSKYVFVSFFNDKTSKAILPISFSPKPDIYRSVVFYFKQLDGKPTYSVQPPKFDKIQRHGFTAVEVSEIVE